MTPQSKRMTPQGMIHDGVLQAFGFFESDDVAVAIAKHLIRQPSNSVGNTVQVINVDPAGQNTIVEREYYFDWGSARQFGWNAYDGFNSNSHQDRLAAEAFYGSRDNLSITAGGRTYSYYGFAYVATPLGNRTGRLRTVPIFEYRAQRNQADINNRFDSPTPGTGNFTTNINRSDGECDGNICTAAEWRIAQMAREWNQ